MTSRAERKRVKKFVATRKGRPLKAGPRHPCGKLKTKPAEPITPNEAVLIERAARLGIPRELLTAINIRESSHPLDLAKHREWISPIEHKAGEALIDLYRRSGFDLPSLRVQDFAKEVRGHSSGEGDERAMFHLRNAMESLRHWPKARAMVFEVAVQANFLPWMQLEAGDIRLITGRNRLKLGLRLVAVALGLAEVESASMAA